MVDIFGNTVEEKPIKKVKTVATPPLLKKVKTVKQVATSDIGTKISFSRVEKIDPSVYEDFNLEKYPRGAIFFDFEVFPHDWLVVFIDTVNNERTIIVNDRKTFVSFYMKNKDNLHFAYNNRNYDNNIYKGILLGMNPKEINDKIIIDGLKGFQISDEFKNIQLYAFDCYKLGHSLKQYESFLQLDIEETEVPFDLPRHLTQKEIDMTIFYCNHDVESTIEVFRRSHQTYDAHMDLIEMYDLKFDCINKTSAQIVAEILKCKKDSHDDSDQWDIVLPPNLDVGKYQGVVDWFMNEENHDLSKSFTMNVCGVPHDFGWGGVHSALSKVRIEGGNIWHIDVQSYYPSLLIFAKVKGTNKTIGELAFGAEGARIYKEIYELRLRLKHEGKKKEQAPLKIVLNGTYGILRDKNSSAYFPRCATLISVFGQMYLVDLLYHLEKANCCSIVQSNTDGLIVKCDNAEQVKVMNEICDDWEKRTLMNLERDEINYIQQKDVNNYLFEFANKKIEVKGAYLKDTNDLDNDLPIVNETIREYIKNKVNIDDYINNCDDFYKFMKTFKVSGNYKCAYHNGVKKNNKCFRVFASKDLKDSYLGKQKEDGDTVEKFAGQSEHSFIENGDIHGKKCSDYPKLDKRWYIDLVYKRLEDFGIDCKPNIFDF